MTDKSLIIAKPTTTALMVGDHPMDVRAGRVEVVQGPAGAAATMAVWEDVPALALPCVDAVAFRRGDENLLIAPFARVREQLADMIEEKPGYPPRCLTRGFPEDWQLEQLREKPA